MREAKSQRTRRGLRKYHSKEESVQKEIKQVGSFLSRISSRRRVILQRVSQMKLICNSHLTATERSGIVNSAQRHQRRRDLPRRLRARTSLIGIQGISMGPGPVMLHIFMNKGSSEVWREKQWEQGAIYCVGVLP